MIPRDGNGTLSLVVILHDESSHETGVGVVRDTGTVGRGKGQRQLCGREGELNGTVEVEHPSRQGIVLVAVSDAGVACACVGIHLDEFKLSSSFGEEGEGGRWREREETRVENFGFQVGNRTRW